MKGHRAAVLMALLLVSSCRLLQPASPAGLQPGERNCRECRKKINDLRFAAQLAVPAQEAQFFDDIDCLKKYLVHERAPLQGAVAYVVDHRTREWVMASRAVYTRCPNIETPAGSHLVAHADEASRNADTEVCTEARIRMTEIFGAAGPPAGQF